MSHEIVFKRPTEEDLVGLKPYDWDITFGHEHEEYTIIRVEGCPHSCGGKRGINDLYAFPRNQKPSVDNIIPFNGEVCWSFEVKQLNVNSKNEITDTVTANIYCAGKLVYQFQTKFSLAASKCVLVIEELKEHPLEFGVIGSIDRIVGRKVYYDNKPGIITHYNRSGFVLIEPDGDVEDFGKACYESDEDYHNNFEGYVKEDILSSSIFWFR